MDFEYFFCDIDGNEFNGETQLSEIRKHYLKWDRTAFLLNELTRLRFYTDKYQHPENRVAAFYHIMFYLILNGMTKWAYYCFSNDRKSIDEAMEFIIEDNKIGTVRGKTFEDSDTVDNVYNFILGNMKSEIIVHKYPSYYTYEERSKTYDLKQFLDCLVDKKNIELAKKQFDAKKDYSYEKEYNQLMCKKLLMYYGDVFKRPGSNSSSNQTFKPNKTYEKIKAHIEKGDKQIILTGAPGTGKTYTALGLAKKKAASYKMVQFHSSFDYTDFVEGLKPIEDENGNTEFRRVDGVFKAFCREAEAARIVNNAKKALTEDNNDSKDPLYIFIIDEINRADLSRVFGEIMFCLEESYRGPKNKINTQYQSLKTYDADGKLMDGDVFADGFYIPENVIIIGTMNDIDRSVETFDFALRRRFKWEEVDAMESMEDLGLNEGDELYDRINALNKAIEKHLGKDFQLGMAYFRKAVEHRKAVEQGDNFNPETYYKTYYDEELKFILNEYVRGMNDKDIKLGEFKEEFTNAKANGQQ